MARPRKKGFRDLPPNLIYDSYTGFYRYRHPETKKYKQMTKNKSKAVAAAKQLNSMLMTGQDLVAEVLGGGQRLKTFIPEVVLPFFEKKEKALAEKTLKAYRQQAGVIVDGLGHCKVSDVTVLQVDEFLRQFEQTPNTLNKYRGFLGQIFKLAMAKGLRADNPALATLKETVRKKRQRLTWDNYQTIFQAAPPWLQHAMTLSFITLQRVNEVARMQFTDVKVENMPHIGAVEFLYVIQQKTKKHGNAAFLKIEVNPELKQLITQCRDDIASPYLIHRRPSKMPRHEKRVSMKTKHHYTQVTPEYISKEFSKVRDELKLYENLDLNARPTFHEIRSLGIALKENQGHDAQALAGHTNRHMTDHYKQGHDVVQWTCVSLNKG